MKKLIFLLLSFCTIFSFISNGQERQNEARKKLQWSLDAQSEKLENIPGWSMIENKEGKFWKQSVSDLPCCPNEAFQYVQTYKFTLEGQIFYLLTIKYDNHYFRTFAFKGSSLKRLEDIINAADGKTYNALEIEYCEIYIDINSEVLFNPELAIQNKVMIRSLLLGEDPPNVFGNGGCKGNYFFKINSQILKGEKIVRFNIIPKDDSRKFQDNTLPPTNNYFELKKNDFEKLFKFNPYTSTNKPNEKYSDPYIDAIARAEVAFNDGRLRSAIMIYKEAQSIDPIAKLPTQKIKEIEAIISQQKVAADNATKSAVIPSTSIPSASENKKNSDQYLDGISRAENAFKVGLLKEAIMIYKEAQMNDPKAELPTQKIKEIETLIAQQKGADGNETKNTVNPLSSSSSASETTSFYVVSCEKTYFYHDPDSTTQRQAYLIVGQRFLGGEIENGYITAEFTNAAGKQTNGWIKISDVRKE